MGLSVLRLVILFFVFLAETRKFNLATAALKIAKAVSKHTKSDWDNDALMLIASSFREQTKAFQEPEILEIAERITANESKILKDLTISLDSKSRIRLKTPFGSIKYDPKNGSVEVAKDLQL